MKNLTEAEKNFFVCAGLMVICGIGLILMSKMGLGIACFVFGVIFAAAPFIMRKQKKEDDAEESGDKTNSADKNEK